MSHVQIGTIEVLDILLLGHVQIGTMEVLNISLLSGHVAERDSELRPVITPSSHVGDVFKMESACMERDSELRPVITPSHNSLLPIRNGSSLYGRGLGATPSNHAFA